VDDTQTVTLRFAAMSAFTSPPPIRNEFLHQRPGDPSSPVKKIIG